MIIKPDMLLFYVEDVARSADFYSDLLGAKPVEQSGGFAMFVLQGGLMFGLWRRDAVEPKAQFNGGGGEIAFSLPSVEAVAAQCETWRANGVRIAQEPVEMDFGFTAVVLDPDQHRIRIFHPSQR